jgi:putative transposase
VLQTDRMAELFIDVLRSYVAAKRFQAHDFVLMRNHVHLLITISGEMTLEKAVQLIKGNFSCRAKKELQYSGQVWQRGFSDVRITGRESFVTHQDYIHNNPVQAGWVDSPEEYRYGSAYLKKMKKQGLKPNQDES